MDVLILISCSTNNAKPFVDHYVDLCLIGNFPNDTFHRTRLKNSVFRITQK